MQLIEAVPNVSEGRCKNILRTLADTLRAHRQIKLLSADSSPAANRTVFTLVGSPQSVSNALFDFIKQATQLIDMRLQHGVHPRLGTVDVCPLVPLQNISLQETAQWAAQLGKRVGEELKIPVYLYEAAATRATCQNLADIRRGEYENLKEKLRILPPDFGPKEFSAKIAHTGACIIGARPFLIAFNINLNTRDERPAKQIAAKIRQRGGGLPGVKAIGWYIDDFKCAQVSCNITDFHVAPLPAVFEVCKKEAAELGVQATGCELVGLIPLDAMLQAGHYYRPLETDMHTLVQTVVERLNLSEVKPFNPHEQILEIKAGLTQL